MMQLLQGDCLTMLATLPAQSVQTVVTSPPYYGLRDYGTAAWEGGSDDCDHTKGRGGNLKNSVHSTKGGANKVEEGQRVPYLSTCGKCGAVRVDQQIGLEETPEEYVAKLVEVFREVKRILREDGTCWLNLGDSYWNSTFIRPTSSGAFLNKGDEGYGEFYAANGGGVAGGKRRSTIHDTLKPKDLIGIPWRVAFALQADGWYLRSDIIWHKPNPMPESVTDRPTKAHEYIFLLSKSERYFYDAEAVREPHANPKWTNDALRGNWARKSDAKVDNSRNDGGAFAAGKSYADTINPNGRNRRTVWTVSTKPYSGAHFAVFPMDLIEPCILAGTSAKGCCPECGKGWERVVEKIGKSLPVSERHGRTGHNGQPPQISGNYWTGPTTKATEEWQPTCDCPAAEPVPCVVLDPFAGAGTTGVVSVKHGRAFVGVELNPEYWQMAKDRIEAEIARPKQLGLAI